MSSPMQHCPVLDIEELEDKSHLSLMQCLPPSLPNFTVMSPRAAEIAVIPWNKRDQNPVPLKCLAKIMKSRL